MRREIHRKKEQLSIQLSTLNLKDQLQLLGCAVLTKDLVKSRMKMGVLHMTWKSELGKKFAYDLKVRTW